MNTTKTLQILDIRIQDRQQPTYRNGRMEPSWGEYTSKPRCHIFPKGENVMENLFVGRRNRPVDVYKREVIPAVKQAIVDRVMASKRGDDRRVVTTDEVQARWSQKAGCSCGCSPGFIVTVPEAIIDMRYDIFVDVEAADDAAAVTPEAKPVLDRLRDEADDAREPDPVRTGRGPNGNLRNFRAMGPEKLREVAKAVLREGNDFDAEEAVLVALGVKEQAA